ncbi:hypothetical protein BT96DRAFT_1009664 [Gymnopus androsaceus JB14]|uniref:Uncharacterized protein n=1 Tax=Gymnopus androsaceus JB14 TaxID=1447944 RepID=A0A6A4GC39_9AGAR|nr:hypothetical protein BT96DRAFT_1009664 [Gymnopus androsaceus JB14]
MKTEKQTIFIPIVSLSRLGVQIDLGLIETFVPTDSLLLKAFAIVSFLEPSTPPTEPENTPSGSQLGHLSIDSGADTYAKFAVQCLDTVQTPIAVDKGLFQWVSFNCYGGTKCGAKPCLAKVLAVEGDHLLYGMVSVDSFDKAQAEKEEAEEFIAPRSTGPYRNSLEGGGEEASTILPLP